MPSCDAKKKEVSVGWVIPVSTTVPGGMFFILPTPSRGFSGKNLEQRTKSTKICSTLVNPEVPGTELIQY